jgi:hypothetical protein
MRNSIFFVTRIAMPVCIYLLVWADGARGQSDDNNDPTLGRIVCIVPKGGLKVRQAKGVDEIQASEGMLVRRGHLLFLDARARASMVCGDGKKRNLAPGLQGSPCTRPCTPEVCGIRYDGSTIGATRGPDTDKGTFPVVISPRKTLVANLRPTIRWTPVAGSTEKTTYNVTLYTDGMKAIWTRNVVAQTRLAYPDNEPPLVAGQTYKVVVTSEGLSSEQDPSPGLGFTILTADQTRALADEESKREKLELSEPQTRLLISNLYAARELYAEAIERLEELYWMMNEPAVAAALGDLYATIGLNREAEKRYLEALRLTPANDFDGRGMIDRNLAQVYENLGNLNLAIARLREAITAYRRLKKIRMVNALLNEERRLKMLLGRR